MTHVVTQSCVGDGSCVYACPVNCIQPTPDDPAFELAEMLHIDPATCVDCGACLSACPVDAIKPHTRLDAGERAFLEINAGYHRRPRAWPALAPVRPPLRVRAHRRPLHVAIVGSGPAAMYAADEVLTIPGARVDVYERLPAPYGLAQAGIAPDHRRTRRIVRQLDLIRRNPRLKLYVGVDVGGDITHDELLDGHDAVIYAVGAATDRRLDIPGANLPGVTSATHFVGWYNGHPDHADRDFDLSHSRAIVIGNGNVALDVARMLTIDPAALVGTDIAPAALAALRASRIEEVVVTARRGPEASAFTLPEFVGLTSTPSIGVEVVPSELEGAPTGDRELDMLRLLAADTRCGRRVKLRYRLLPERVHGDQAVTAVQFDRETIAAGLVITSIGYRGKPVPGLPFDEVTGAIPNEAGRVLDPATRAPVPGVYVAGWIKRGPAGFIGTNKPCSQDTVLALVEDFNAGCLGA